GNVRGKRGLNGAISGRGKRDGALGPRHRRPRLYPGPAPRLHVIGAAGEHDPPQHRSLAAMRRQDGDRLGLSGGRLHAGNRRLPRQAGLTWTTDVTYADLPIKIHTAHGTIAGVPTTDFSDNRVLRANPRDLYHAHKGTFEYLVENEPMGLLVLVIHCQFGGRPLITAVLNELLAEFARSSDVWFARHEELARWALDADVD